MISMKNVIKMAGLGEPFREMNSLNVVIDDNGILIRISLEECLKADDAINMIVDIWQKSDLLHIGDLDYNPDHRLRSYLIYSTADAVMENLFNRFAGYADRIANVIRALSAAVLLALKENKRNE